MNDSVSSASGTTQRSQAKPQKKTLALAVVLVSVGSLTPWVDTAFGNLNGIAGGGLWTLYAAAIGLAGLFLKRPRIVGLHALVLAAPALVIPIWQFARLVPLGGFGTGWTPGFGLIAVFGGGVLALRTAMPLLHRSRN